MSEETEDTQLWKACRVHFVPGHGHLPHCDIGYDEFEDLNILDGALILSNEEGSWLHVFAAGSWSHFEYV